MNFRPVLNGLAVQAKSTTNRLRVPGPLVAGGKIGAAGRPCVPLHRATQPKHCIPMLLDPPAHHHMTGKVQLQCDDRQLLGPAPIRRLRLAPPPHSSYRRIRRRGSPHAPILSLVSDKSAQVRNTRLGPADVYALTAITAAEVDRIITTTTAVAGLFVPDQFDDTDTLLLDGTLIPVHDQSITRPGKNYRRSVNIQVMATLHRRIVHVGNAWPANRNDIIIATATITLPASITTLTGGGYRSMPGATLPPTDDPGRLAEHRRRRARIEHILARIKDWQILRQCQCRRRGNAINLAARAVAYLWNTKLAH